MRLREELDLVMNGETNVVLCGDLNVHLSELDTKNRFRLSPATKKLIEILQELSLVDVWREKYRDKRQYTWRRCNPTQQSRIDYVLVGESLLRSNVLKCIEIKAGICSDHCMVNFELVVHNSDKGRGLFKFDNILLEDIEFVEYLCAEIEKAKIGEGIYQDVNDIGLKIEMLTSEIRVKNIKFGSWKARKKKENERVLLEKVERLEMELATNHSDELAREYVELKDKLEQEEEK